jgi:protein NirF
MSAERLAWLLALALTAFPAGALAELGLVIERATGSVQIIDNATRATRSRVDGLGDLSHASAVFSPDARHAFVFGRDGGLTKIALEDGRVVGRVVQSGNAIGGAISKDGRIVAVANYVPGGVKLFDAHTLEQLAEIPATYGTEGRRAKVVGIVDAPGDRFVFSLFEAGEIWIADVADPRAPRVTRLAGVGREPYDALITPDGRHYVAGLFGEDGLALVDLADVAAGARRILPNYGRGEEKLPVYKMPHLRGWAVAGPYVFLPAIGRHEVLVVERASWREVARIPAHGQPVFVMARPGGGQVWVNFAFPRNDTVQVIDVARLAVVETLVPGRAVLHMEFSAGGEEAWVSARDDDTVAVYDTAALKRIADLPARSPSGIFFTWRALKTGL